MKALKNSLTPKNLCDNDYSIRLLPFVQAVYDLEFEEEPNYEKLRFLLLSGLLERD